MAELIGTKIAGYRVESMLSRGGMGEVYLAEQDSPKRMVALKLLSPELSGDAGFRERFVRESEAAASIDHPNVIPIYQSGQTDGALFIAMRYVDGTDLRALLGDEGPLPPERAIRICAQIGDALEAAHERGLVHRDVKPANILVGKGDHAYLSDFGLIRRAEVSAAFTKTGQFMGTIDYVAPEQIKGQSVDGRTDVYSLGCVLYECLTGEPPYRRETEVATLYAHLEDPPPKPSAKIATLPDAFDDVVARAMAKQPDERYPTAAAFAGAAMKASDDRHLLVRPQRRWSRTWLGAAAVVMVALVSVIAMAIRADPDAVVEPQGATTPRAAEVLPAHSVTEIDPATGGRLGTPIEGVSISESVSTWAGQPKMSAGGGGLWIVGQTGVTHVDPLRGEIEAEVRYQTEIQSSAAVADIAADFRLVWVTSFVIDKSLTNQKNTGALARIDPATNELLRRLAFRGSGGATGVAAGTSSIWATFSAGVVLEIDPATGTILREENLGGGLDAIAVGGGRVWVADSLAGTVAWIDERTGELGEPIDVGGSIDGLAASEDGVWVLDAVAGTVTRVDLSGSIGQPLRIGEQATDLISTRDAGQELIWATDATGELYRVDTSTNAVTSTDLGAPLAAIAPDPERESLWVLVP